MIMKNNEALQQDVQDAIKWEPLLRAAEIGVTANDGVITLTGTVDSYAKKTEAEEAAKNVAGVKAVVEKIEIKFGGTWRKDDNEIATEVVSALRTNWDVPKDKVHVKVEQGWVSLSGDVQWAYQKEATKNAVKNLAGVKGVTNGITIKPEAKDAIEKEAIEQALLRNWAINDQDIHVKVSGNRVTLTGIVDSVYQRNEAGRLAWNAPGVYSVDNELVIEYDYITA
jgi:osmotically-inducible protein OsmY